MGERSCGNDAATGRRTGGTTSQESDRSVDGECVRAVLGHPWRQRVLDVVTDLGGTTVRDLATRIASREHDVEPDAVTEHQRHTVEVSLYHVHLPKLDEVDVLEVDFGRNRVTTGPNAGQVEALLSGLESTADLDAVVADRR